VKPNLTIYDKLGLLCKNKSGTVSDDQLLVDGKWENVEFPSHSHQVIPIPMSIPMKLAWRFPFPWEFPIYTQLYHVCQSLYTTADAQ